MPRPAFTPSLPLLSSTPICARGGLPVHPVHPAHAPLSPLLPPRHSSVPVASPPRRPRARVVVHAAGHNAPVQPPSSSAPAADLRRRALLALAAVGGCAAIVAALPRILSAYSVVSEMHAGVGMLIVGLGNFVSVISCFPANMGLMISAGAALGARNAFVALYLSKLMAATCAFLLAKGVLAGWAQRRLAAFPKLNRALRKSSQGGWRMVLTMRLSPFPGFLLNYLLSVTGVGMAPYVVGTAIGILPSIANLALLGAAAREVGVGAAGGGINWLRVLIKVLMLGATVMVMAFVTKEAKKAFDEEEDAPSLKSGEDSKSYPTIVE